MRFPRGTCYEITINNYIVKFKLLGNYVGMPGVNAKICETEEIVDAYDLLRYDISSLKVVECDDC